MCVKGLPWASPRPWNTHADVAFTSAAAALIVGHAGHILALLVVCTAEALFAEHVGTAICTVGARLTRHLLVCRTTSAIHTVLVAACLAGRARLVGQARPRCTTQPCGVVCRQRLTDTAAALVARRADRSWPRPLLVGRAALVVEASAVAALLACRAGHVSEPPAGFAALLAVAHIAAALLTVSAGRIRQEFCARAAFPKIALVRAALRVPLALLAAWEGVRGTAPCFADPAAAVFALHAVTTGHRLARLTTFSKVTLPAAAVLIIVTPFAGRKLEVRTTCA